MTEKRNWPLVSVCILSYNRLRYLKRTLESFLDTCTYPDLEYILVDNNSDQEVVDYISSLQFIEKKILNNKNYGMGYAMNQARREAQGEYFFNLENDWYFFYRSNWVERGVLLFEKDRRGECVHKKPSHLPLGIVKFKIGAGLASYTNNPSLVSREAYESVGEYPQLGREYKYISEDIHRIEKDYKKIFKMKFAGAISETPCAVHIGGNTTNPNYGNRGKREFHELDGLLDNEWKNGKWWVTYQLQNLGNRFRVRNALRKYRLFDINRERGH
jgi:glycosyltransferase involved in cell wall biosynthesis